MTQPIQEPSTDRALQGFAYARDQIFRRPAPVAAAAGGGLGIPDLIIANGGTTVNGNTWIPVPFEDLWYPASTTLGDVFDAVVTDSGDPGNDRWEVSTDPEGWFAFELITEWDQTSTPSSTDFGAATQRMTWDTALGFTWAETYNRESADWLGDTSPAYEGFEMFDNSRLTQFRILHVPANKTWKPLGLHRTGAATSRGLSGIICKFWYLGADDMSGWTVDSV